MDFHRSQYSHSDSGITGRVFNQNVLHGCPEGSGAWSLCGWCLLRLESEGAEEEEGVVRNTGLESSDRWQRGALGSPLCLGSCETEMNSCHRIPLKVRGKQLPQHGAAPPHPPGTDVHDAREASPRSSMVFESLVKAVICSKEGH